MHTAHYFYLAIVGFLLVQCSEKAEVHISYPKEQPDSIALSFLPNLVSRPDSLDFNSAFSSDGKLFYFARSQGGKYDIYQTAFEGNTWKTPVLAPFSTTEYSEADPFILPDGSIYFISDKPKDALDTLRDFDIWVIHPEKNGTWSTPQNIQEVNSDSTEYYVSLSSNGNLYFASNRPGGYGSHDIYVSRFVNDKYSTPVNLGPAVNTTEMEHDPLISRDERFIIFTSVNRPDGFGQGDLYYATRKAVDAPWSSSTNLGEGFNTPTYEYCSYLTPDNKFFFFSSDYDVKWVSAEKLPIKIK
jgi:hypothetical protein